MVRISVSPAAYEAIASGLALDATILLRQRDACRRGVRANTLARQFSLKIGRSPAPTRHRRTPLRLRSTLLLLSSIFRFPAHRRRAALRLRPYSAHMG